MNLRVLVHFAEEGSYLAVPFLRQLAAGILPLRPGFETGKVQVGYVVDKVARGQVSLRVLVFPCQYHSTVAAYSYIIWG
jgi:hypothetical protein